MFNLEEWNIGIVYEPISAFLSATTKHQIHWLPPAGRGKYFADPFGVTRNGRTYILCEEFDYRTFRGRIVCIELVDKKAMSQPTVAIEPPFHVSYPYVFEYEGKVYCVPETRRAGEIGLYQAEELPSRWKKVATLVSGFSGVDSTLFQYRDLWWLASVDHAGSMHRLFIWYSEGPLGPWKSHAANPVKADYSSSRPGGTPFICDDCLYRPAQDCSNSYGRRVIINHVTKLTCTEFKEEKVAVVEPYATDPYPDGLHTISSIGNATLVDGKRFLSRISSAEYFVARQYAKIKSLIAA